jgi:8-oxo-dGTP diphosphatase
MADIHKAGLLVVRDGAVLLCRKRHTTSKLILPGGKFERGESAAACLDRELAEELGAVRVPHLEYLGTYRHRAAHDDPAVQRHVVIELYGGELDGTPRPQAEIVELVWFDAASDPEQLAPSLRERIFPDLVARRLVPWERCG